MVNVDKLKDKIGERSLTIETLSEKTGIEKSRLYRRLKKPARFTIAEVNSIVGALNLSMKEAIDIFFTH